MSIGIPRNSLKADFDNAFCISKLTEEQRDLIKSDYKITDHHFIFEIGAGIKISMQVDPELQMRDYFMSMKNYLKLKKVF